MFEPFHSGEVEMQRRTGERAAAQQNSGMVSDEIYDGARAFIERQTFAVLASESANGQLLASPLFGVPGLLHTPDARTIEIDLRDALTLGADGVKNNLVAGARVGALMIELETRRRVRANGTILRASEDNLLLGVHEFFGNCGKYIQRRKIALSHGGGERSAAIAAGSILTESEAVVIAHSDTMFVASANPDGDLDVSHRGGNTGFIKVVNDRQLLIPDYSGNSMFTTFGNFQVDDRAAIVLFDFEQQIALQVAGTARVLLNQMDPPNATGGTKRFWTLDIESWQTSSIARVQQQFIDYSPWNPRLAANF